MTKNTFHCLQAPVWAAATAALLSGCAITMPAAQVEPEAAPQWQAPLPHAGAVADLSQWWQAQGDATLVEFIEAAQAVSPGVAQALARIESARANQAQALQLYKAVIDAACETQAPPLQRDPRILQLMAAIEQAQLTDVLKQLPEGLDTRVGERGVQLSGGQRQRIGIARALYKQADVLVLDEATSALDSETEAKVMEKIYTLNPSLVVLMIAHRTSTLAQCDEIYKMANGRLAPVGLEKNA